MNTERKDSVPKGFTLSMALMDCLPVLFFTISAIFIALHFPSLLFLIGIFFVILAGLLKVSWKLIIALAHRDIRFFNIQLRYLMPLGFLIVIYIFATIRQRLEIADVPTSFKGAPIALITAGIMACAIMGIAGVV